MRILRVLPAIALLFFVALHAAEAPVKTAPVQTAFGPVIGEESNGIRIFRGIPYATPPVGELRWTYAKPPAPWTEPRECLKFSLVCPQPTVPLYGDLGPSSEDCLYLNVWTAAKVTDDKKISDEKKPVLFWVHGGGFGIGAASQIWYEGTRLALDGVIVVSCNYRLGPFGFLAHPALTEEMAAAPVGFAKTGKISGNYGFSDIALALDWTCENIQRFGGDPTNITVMGESAGGAAVAALMASQEHAAHKFQRAVIMSTNTGVPMRFREKPNDKLQSMEELGVEFQKRLNLADVSGPELLKQMRAKTPAEIMKAGRPGSAVPGVSTTDNLIVDGDMLDQPVMEKFKLHDVLPIPVMIGNVAEEGSMFERRMKLDTVAKYKEYLVKRYGEKADQAFAIYTAATDADVRPALTELFTDIFMRSSRLHARFMLDVPAPKPHGTYVYDFTRKAKPMIDSGWGVYHGSEVPYFFGTVEDKENTLTKTANSRG